MEQKEPWWKRGVVYQLLVPTFYDSNDDGIGDLPGVTSKLEYLQWLGVDAVWLSPIYDSPFVEMGYDPSDYTTVNAQFGTIDDFDELLREAHRRNLRVILDWIPNHTSFEHPWFVASRSSREDPKRDWYIWRDPQSDGSPPNNWLSIFGGSVWEYDHHTEQYYLHTFLPEQPDLNWWNPEVRFAVMDAMRFWLDRGVDGFRLDAIDLLVKHPEFPDNPANPEYDPEKDGPDMAVLPKFTRDQPAVHEFVADMRLLVDGYDDRVLLGELYLPIDRIVAYYGADRPELHLPLNPTFGSLRWEHDELRGTIDEVLSRTLDLGWPSWMISTHDGRRVASRAGAEQAPTAAMMLLTLPGTPILYYGDEIGMHDVEIPAEKERDPQGKRIGRKRDPVRTPMQWNVWANAGFTSGEPWLPVSEDYPDVNVRAQSDGHSMLALYRHLLALRREEPALTLGTCTLEDVDEPVLAYRRELEADRLVIFLNLGPDPRNADLGAAAGRVRLSTYFDRDGEETGGSVTLRPNEGLIVDVGQ